MCRWRHTGEWNSECTEIGKEGRDEKKDKNCDEIIDDDVSGFCECSNLNKTMKAGCQKGEFQTCFTACKGNYFNAIQFTMKIP